VPKGVLKPVVQTMTRVWEERIANSQRLKDYAARGAVHAAARPAGL
jgi:hypothetical protein